MPPIELLRECNFFDNLAAAAKASSNGSAWPEDSRCFPVMRKLAFTCKRLIACGCVSDVREVIHCILQFLLHSDECRGDRAHHLCIDAVIMYISAGGNIEDIRHTLQAHSDVSQEEIISLVYRFRGDY